MYQFSGISGQFDREGGVEGNTRTRARDEAENRFLGKPAGWAKIKFVGQDFNGANLISQGNVWPFPSPSRARPVNLQGGFIRFRRV